MMVIKNQTEDPPEQPAIPTGQSCEITGCQSPATAQVRWGEEDGQSGQLCEPHILEVWSEVKALVATGQCFWIQTPLEDKHDNAQR